MMLKGMLHERLRMNGSKNCTEEKMFSSDGETVLGTEERISRSKLTSNYTGGRFISSGHTDLRRWEYIMVTQCG